MTGSTHIAIGIVSSLAILQPKTIPQCLCAATGGMIGGMISDIDHPKKRESIHYTSLWVTWLSVKNFCIRQLPAYFSCRSI